MNLAKKLPLLLCAISLTACVTPTQNGKLHTDYAKHITLPTDAKVAEIYEEKPVRVFVPTTSVVATGHPIVMLASLAISAASTAASHAIRADETKAIKESIEGKDMYSASGKTYVKTVGNADWINVTDVEQVRDVTKGKLKEIQTSIAKDSGDAQSVVFLTSRYVIGEQYENLTQIFQLEIYPVKDGKKGMKVYSVNLSEVFYPEEGLDKGFENHTLWIENDNALIKEAIRETTETINKNLNALISSPYPAPKEEETKVEDETVEDETKPDAV